MFQLQQLDHVAITVSDMQRAIAWYETELGLEHRSHWDGDPQMMCVGETCVALFTGEASEGQGGIEHFAFRVDRANFDAAQEQFRERGTEFRFADHGVCHSVYITDPDNHTIEITTYEV